MMKTEIRQKNLKRGSYIKAELRQGILNLKAGMEYIQLVYCIVQGVQPWRKPVDCLSTHITKTYC
jgi:hypothetical protein